MLLPISPTLRPIRRVQVVLLAWCVVGAGHAELPDTAGTLPEDYLPPLKAILDTAMKQAPQVVMKEIEIAQMEARVLGADAQRLPNLGGHANLAQNQTAIASNANTRSRDNGLFYDISLTQPLFTWGALKNQSEIARIGVAIAEKNYAEARRTLAVALRQQYLMLIAKKAFVRQARFDLQLKQAEVKFFEDKLAEGTASEGELAAKRLTTEDASLQLARIEAEFAAQRRAFARLAGLSGLDESAVPDEIPKPRYSADNTTELLAGMLRDGGKSTFAAEVAALRVKEADLNYRIAKVRLLPKFNAQAGYSVQNSTNATANSVSQTGVSQQSVAVVGSWNIFDGFATRGAMREAMATKRLRERELQVAAESAVDAAQKLERELALDARAMDMSDVRRTLAAAGLGRAKEELALGNVAQTAIEGAQLGLYIADFNNANNRATFLWHWSEFVSLAVPDPSAPPSPSSHAR